MTHVTNRSDFPAQLPAVATKYCFLCHATGVMPRTHGNREWWYCAVCGKESERFLTWDPNMRQSFDDQGRLVHYGAGMFVMNDADETLLFMRKKFPFLWTIPGGHLEVGEDPSQCGMREVLEEVGLTVRDPELVYNDIVEHDSCQGGADVHHWHLYKAASYDGNVRIQADEGEPRFRWMKLDDIPLDEVTGPVRFFLTNPQIVGRLRA